MEHCHWKRNVRRLGYQCLNFYFKGEGDIMNSGMHRGVKLLEHVMKIVEKLHGKNCNNR